MFQSNLKRRPRVEITPLIDVIFLILIFFMLFSNFETAPAGIEINLPRAETGTDQAPSEVVVTVSSDGDLLFDGDPVSAADLEDSVRDAVSQSNDLLVVVRGDRDASYDDVVRAMDVVRQAGGYQLGLSVRPE